MDNYFRLCERRVVLKSHETVAVHSYHRAEKVSILKCFLYEIDKRFFHFAQLTLLLLPSMDVNVVVLQKVLMK